MPPQAEQEPQRGPDLRDAALELVRADEAYRDALNGQGHPGEDHDRALHHHELCTPEYEFYDYTGDCAACGGAQYGTEDERHRAMGRLRAALGLEVRPWEYPEDVSA